jgi:hypothetical protein
MAKRNPVQSLLGKSNGPPVATAAPPAPAKKPGRGRGVVAGPIEIRPPKIEVIVVEIRGNMPLIVHSWSVKAVRQMLHKQMKIPDTGREAKDPQRDFENSRLISTAGWDGVPCTALKSAFAEAARQVPGLTMTMAKRLVFVEPDGVSVTTKIEIPATDSSPAFTVPFGGVELVRIYGEPTLRCDMVRIDGGNTADIRFRAEYKQWSARLQIRYNANILMANQVVHLVATAGLSEGIGEWRPSAPHVTSGSYGTWDVVR